MRFIALFLIFSALVGCIPPDNPEKIKEHLAFPETKKWTKGSQKVAVIPVSGVLVMPQESSSSDPLGGSQPDIVAQTRRFLRHAAHDEDVIGTVLIVDSPGGGVSESALIHEEILRFKKTGKPLIVWQRRVAASGGYYISAPADHIMAHPTSITGSIGVITMFPNLTGLMEKLGLQAHTIKSGKMKDSGSPVRPFTSEDKEYFQDLIDQMYAQFLDVILEGRTQLTRDALQSLADGRVFTAQEALKHKLVDSLGSLEDAIEKTIFNAVLRGHASKIKKTKVVEYDLVKPGLQITLTQAQMPAPGIDISLRLPEISSPGLWYLWQPEIGLN